MIAIVVEYILPLLALCAIGGILYQKWVVIKAEKADLKALQERQKANLERENDAAWRRNQQTPMR